MTDETINLPPLVGTLTTLTKETQSVVLEYGKACARAAVLADRQSPESVALRKDVQRYHWLKRRSFCNVWERGDGISLVIPRGCAGDADAMIDIAMETKP